MSLDNFQRKENTDSSLNTSKEATKEATKETQNSLNSLKKEIISGYVKQTDKQRPQPTQAPSTNSEKSDNWLVNKMVSGANKMVSGARETVSTMVSGATETFSTIVSRAKEFFESIPKRLVNTDDFPPEQIPILKSMIKAGQRKEVFKKRYGKEWTWKIDCSGFVSLLLRAGGALTDRLSSSELFKKFGENTVELKNVIAGDLMFWKRRNTIYHVEMVVWKPYKNNNGELCVNTLWSSSDTTNVSPMYDINGSAYSKRDGVAYRERVIQGKHQFLRPQYGTPVAENQKKEK